MSFMKKGWIAQTHAHRFDHQTLLTSGALRITTDGRITDYHAPAILLVQAGTKHRFEALEDGTVAYCVHALSAEDSLVESIENHHLHSLA